MYYCYFNEATNISVRRKPPKSSMWHECKLLYIKTLNLFHNTMSSFINSLDTLHNTT